MKLLKNLLTAGVLIATAVNTVGAADTAGATGTDSTLSPAAGTVVHDTIHFTVTKTGRKILLDGFLMEWRTESAHPWDGNSDWIWDVVATPEGLAGYLRLQKPAECPSGRISVTSSIDSLKHVILMPSTDSSEIREHRYIRYERHEFDSTKTLTVEWLFPYGKEIPNLTTPMILTFGGENACGDTLPVLALSYTPQPVKTGTKLAMIGQGLLIAVLALLYFAVQRKIRLQTQRQKESPHQ